MDHEDKMLRRECFTRREKAVLIKKAAPPLSEKRTRVTSPFGKGGQRGIQETFGTAFHRMQEFQLVQGRYSL
ncbi:MAG: hypothetical protein AB7E48_11730 [Deferribacterales bacterium]